MAKPLQERLRRRCFEAPETQGWRRSLAPVCRSAAGGRLLAPSFPFRCRKLSRTSHRPYRSPRHWWALVVEDLDVIRLRNSLDLELLGLLGRMSFLFVEFGLLAELLGLCLPVALGVLALVEEFLVLELVP